MTHTQRLRPWHAALLVSSQEPGFPCCARLVAATCPRLPPCTLSLPSPAGKPAPNCTRKPLPMGGHYPCSVPIPPAACRGPMTLTGELWDRHAAYTNPHPALGLSMPTKALGVETGLCDPQPVSRLRELRYVRVKHFAHGLQPTNSNLPLLPPGPRRALREAPRKAGSLLIAVGEAGGPHRGPEHGRWCQPAPGPAAPLTV